MKKIGSYLQSLDVDELREKIIVYTSNEIRDENGNIIKNYKPLTNFFYAKVLPYTAKIIDGQAEKIVSVDYKIAVRYSKNSLKIKVTDYILFNNKKLKIAVPPYDCENAKKFIILECREWIE